MENNKKRNYKVSIYYRTTADSVAHLFVVVNDTKDEVDKFADWIKELYEMKIAIRAISATVEEYEEIRILDLEHMCDVGWCTYGEVNKIPVIQNSKAVKR